MWTWVAFGAVQVVLITTAGMYLLRAVRDHKARGGGVLVIVGVSLVALNVLWFATGGPQGSSFIPLRGGVLGAGLSVITGAELAALGSAGLWLVRKD